MKIPWLIEKDDEYEKILIPVLSKLNIPYKLVNYDFLKFDDGGFDTALIYGSVRFVRQSTKYSKIYYNWLDIDSFKCSYYYNVLQDELLNGDCIFLPFGMIKNSLELIKSKFKLSDDSEIFIRPDSGLKLFQAMRHHCHETLFSQTWQVIEDLSSSNMDSMCLVSLAKQISYEWRFFIVDGKVSTGSLYFEDKEIAIRELSNSYRDYDALEYANKIATRLTKSVFNIPIYTLDICMDLHGKLSVLELNAFNCSGFYACNVEKLVTDVNEYIEKFEI